LEHLKVYEGEKTRNTRTASAVTAWCRINHHAPEEKSL